MLSTPKTVYQQTGRDCLLACYTSVLDSLSKQVNVAQLIDYDRLNADGFAFAELRNYEKDHGVDINGF